MAQDQPPLGNGDESGVAEGIRQLDLLEARQERYQRQAALLLRISLATMGVLAAFGGTKLVNNLAYLFRDNIDLSASYKLLEASQPGVALLNPTSTIFILVVWAIIMISIFTISLILIAVSSFLVVFPDDHEPELGNIGIERYQGNRGSEALLRDYRELIESNIETVSRTRNRLRHSFIAVAASIVSAILSIPPVYALSVDDPYLLQTTGLIGVILVFFLFAIGLPRAKEAEIMWFKTGYFHWEIEPSLILAALSSFVIVFVPSLTPVTFDFPLVFILPLIPPLLILFRDYRAVEFLGFKFLAYSIAIIGTIGILHGIPPNGVLDVFSPKWLLVILLTGLLSAFLFLELQLLLLFSMVLSWLERNHEISIFNR